MELRHVVLRETVTIAHNRMSEVPSEFRNTCQFFGGYTGSSEHTTIQFWPANSMSYMLLMQRSPIQGLQILIEAAVRATIERYREFRMTPVIDVTVGAPDAETYLSWMLEEPTAEFNSNLVVASPPLGPESACYYDDTDDDIDSDEV
ncbi:hypothetical protein BGZ93_005339 [Podila epicladia]|nr:hypothetical protein BGZ92_001660 [Podila epicladia]KAG0100771.1 hypothetical protein BGZ93_005339 [Podila epicladia]